MATLSFGPFVLDSASGALSRDRKPVPLGQRAVVLLQVLVEANGSPVSKAALLERAWPGTIVEEGNLTVQIAALRKALGVTAEGYEWIVTVPRVGYRLLLSQAPEPADVIPLQPALAVLPFTNLSGHPEKDYYADGVVEDIITALARFRGFAVIARNSSFAYRGKSIDVRQIAAELGVRYVLEGSVRRAGDTLRITAQLVDGTTGAHLWARNLDGALTDIFDFQDQITDSVAAVVGPHIERAERERSRRERPGSIAAYDVYLKAREKILAETIPENAEACALLDEALVKYPDDAGLLSVAAWAYEHRITMGWPDLGPNTREKAVRYARRGLELAAGDAMVMAHCAMTLLQTGREYDLGMAVLRDAAEANPNNLAVISAAGVAHLHCGSLDDALALLHRANRLSPRDPFAHIALCGIAHCHMVLGEYEDALNWATRSRAINQSFDPTLWMLIAANAQLGRMDEAHRHLADLVKAAPGVTVTRIRNGQPAKDPTRLASVLEGLRRAGLPES